MKLLEHEAKTLLKKNHLPVPNGHTITLSSDLTEVPFPAVVKSQVPTGGRGKLGGVVIVETLDQLKQTRDTLFTLPIKEFLPQVLLVEEKLAIEKEYYLALLVDRTSSTIRLVAHRQGGIEVEDNNASDFFNEIITDNNLHELAEEVAIFLDCPVVKLSSFIQDLYDAFVRNDATLLEINPLIYTSKHSLVCGDCKMELDDAATFRHPDWDFESTPQNTNFVTLNAEGKVATIANGAGLAMSTVDAVVDRGMSPANFLDIGGGANTESVMTAFNQIVAFPNVQAIVINIFAGITRCDEVAKAIIEAKKRIPSLPPLFIRLAGTNFEEAVTLLAVENIPTLKTLDECLDAAQEALHE